MKSLVHLKASALGPFVTTWRILVSFACLLILNELPAQTLLNIDFGVGKKSSKTGFAGVGQTTNDFWNLYRHYDPNYTPGMPMVSDSSMTNLLFANRTPSPVSITVSNAPGVWGNPSGDPMYDTFVFAPNGSNIWVSISGLGAGNYHLYLYGHADPDVADEYNSIFTVRSGTNVFGSQAPLSSAGWKASSPWQERSQYVVFRDVPAFQDAPILIEVAPGFNGLAVLNGLQILSRGTSPLKPMKAETAKISETITNLIFRESRFEGKVSNNEARFKVNLTVESKTTNEIMAPLFEGDIAVIVPQLSDSLRVVNSARKYYLVATKPGFYPLTLDLVAKITKAEPWNQITFTGPNAAIATVTVQAGAPGVEMQLMSGTSLDSVSESETNKVSGSKDRLTVLRGHLGPDRVLSMRWQSKTDSVTRKSLVSADTQASAQVTPTVIKYKTQFHFEILQAPLPRLAVGVPASHTLTQVQGEQIRDWKLLSVTNGMARLEVEFVKPVEKSYNLTVLTEQAVESTPFKTAILPPQPLEVDRESGLFNLSADDMQVDSEAGGGLRQINAPAVVLAAYRFFGRPIALTSTLTRIEPVIKVADRVSARMEETRLQATHAITLQVEKAGIYAVDFIPPAAYVVSDVRGEGVEEWKPIEGRIKINFNSRVLGKRQLFVLLEQSLKEFPDKITLTALPVTGATNQTSQIGVMANPGILLKTDELNGLREIPVASLPGRSDESLAFVADQPNWSLKLSSEKLSPRIVAEVFNLVAVGDGIVGGSATLRYAIVNQGVQEFKIQLPASWKNVEFTGPNIRRKDIIPSSSTDTNFVQWAISLQDKAWGGYTLVVTYDLQFDPHKASLSLGGIRALGVERETGSIALTSISSLQISESKKSDQLRRVDDTELAETDRSLITHSVLLAYQYSVPQYELMVDVTRFQELPILEAVADRTQLTTVLTEEGQMLTQSSFMIKNNEKQYQKFNLPPDATLWSCFVNNQPVKAEREGNDLLVPLLKQADRDQTFAVDLVYAQKTGRLEKKKTHNIELSAPRTDVQTTYAEWELYVPSTFQADKFGGNMTTPVVYKYRLIDAWRQFVNYYRSHGEDVQGFAILGSILFFVTWILIMATRRGVRRVIEVVIVLGVIGILAAMALPNFVKARAKAQINTTIANLKQLDGALESWALENKTDAFPPSLDAVVPNYIRMMPLDVTTGQQYGYAGAGKSRKTHPYAVIVYTPNNTYGTRDVLLASSEIRTMQEAEFQSALSSGASQPQAGPQGGPTQVAQVISAPVAAPASATTTFLNPNGEAVAVNGLVPGPGSTQGGFRGGASGRMESAPVAAGIRPIRVDIPRSGSRCIFKKVLNVQDEKLVIKARLYAQRSGFQGRGLLTALMFLAGLGITWLQWNRESVSTFKVSLGLAVMLIALMLHLIRTKLLGDAMIIAAPLLVIALLLKILWFTWRRGAKSDENLPPPFSSDGLASSSASLILGLALCGTDVQAQVKTVAPTTTPKAAITSATYRGVLTEKVAQFDASLQMASYATNQVLPLYGSDVSLESFSVSATNCTLLRDGQSVSLRIPDAGLITVNLKLAVKLGGDVTRRQLAFTVPPALSSSLSLVIDEANAEVEFPTAVSFERTFGAKDTRVEAIMGSGDRVEMYWTPRMKRATEVVASVFAQNTTVVTIGSGVINSRTVIDYQITQGEMRQARIRLPAGQRLLRVEGEWLKLWETLSSQGSDVLVVDLIKPLAPAYKLTLEMEKVLGNLPATNKIEIPHALEVLRETGIIGLSAGEELSLNTESVADLQRVDPAEFPKTSGTGVVSAYRFLKPGFGWTVRAETIQPQIEAIVRNSTRIGFEQASLTANLDYTIKKAGVFSLQLTLPANYKVASVVENPAAGIGMNAQAQRPATQQQRAEISQIEKTQELVWTEKQNPHLLEIQLRERKQGNYSVRIVMNQRYSDPPK